MPVERLIDDFELAQPTKENHSWGRTTDGAANWSIFTTPTPAAANAGAVPALRQQAGPEPYLRAPPRRPEREHCARGR